MEWLLFILWLLLCYVFSECSIWWFFFMVNRLVLGLVSMVIFWFGIVS